MPSSRLSARPLFLDRPLNEPGAASQDGARFDDNMKSSHLGSTLIAPVLALVPALKSGTNRARERLKV